MLTDVKTKVLYQNMLIDVHRVNIPLFLLIDKQNGLPIQKIAINNRTCSLEIKTEAIVKPTHW